MLTKAIIVALGLGAGGSGLAFDPVAISNPTDQPWTLAFQFGHPPLSVTLIQEVDGKVETTTTVYQRPSRHAARFNSTFELPPRSAAQLEMVDQGERGEVRFTLVDHLRNTRRAAQEWVQYRVDPRPGSTGRQPASLLVKGSDPTRSSVLESVPTSLPFLQFKLPAWPREPAHGEDGKVERVNFRTEGAGIRKRNAGRGDLPQPGKP